MFVGLHGAFPRETIKPDNSSYLEGLFLNPTGEGMVFTAGNTACCGARAVHLASNLPTADLLFTLFNELNKGILMIYWDMLPAYNRDGMYTRKCRLQVAIEVFNNRTNKPFTIAWHKASEGPYILVAQLPEQKK